MKRNVLLSVLALCVSMLALFSFFIFGCGTNPTSGGGTRAGSPWIYCGNNVDTTILVINGSTNTSTELIDIGSHPSHMAASPDGKKIYCSTDTDTFVIIDTAANVKNGTFEVVNGKTSRGMAVSHDGKFLYLTGPTTTEFFKVYLNDDPTNITFEGVQLTDNITAPGEKLALNSDSTIAYVCMSDGSSSLEVVYLGTLTHESITLSNHPHDIAIKGNYAYVAVSSNPFNVSVVNLSDNSENALSLAPANFTTIVSVPGKDKIYAAEYSQSKIYKVIPAGLPGGPSIEADYITGESFSSPGYMAATADYVYIYDSVPHEKIAVLDVAQDKIVQYIYGIHSDRQIYNNPVIIYK